MWIGSIISWIFPPLSRSLMRSLQPSVFANTILSKAALAPGASLLPSRPVNSTVAIAPTNCCVTRSQKTAQSVLLISRIIGFDAPELVRNDRRHVHQMLGEKPHLHFVDGDSVVT